VIKAAVQRGLKRAGVYHRLRNSWSYDLYWRLIDKRVIENRAREIEFYRQVLSEFRAGALIFDVGANAGQKTDVFVRLGARVVAIEPDEENRSVLYEKFRRWRRVPKAVTIVGKALSDGEGVETMWIEKSGSALNTLSRKWADVLREDGDRVGRGLLQGGFVQRTTVETTTLERVVEAHGRPFYVKIDVEGHELEVLRGLREPVPYLSFEVNLPEFSAEGAECVRLLCRLCGKSEFNYVVDCREGVVLTSWVDGDTFLRVLERCDEGSIEVFWRTICPGQRSE
jgi:FkbM family methyltransferase